MYEIIYAPVCKRIHLIEFIPADILAVGFLYSLAGLFYTRILSLCCFSSVFCFCSLCFVYAIALVYMLFQPCQSKPVFSLLAPLSGYAGGVLIPG